LELHLGHGDLVALYDHRDALEARQRSFLYCANLADLGYFLVDTLFYEENSCCCTSECRRPSGGRCRPSATGPEKSSIPRDFRAGSDRSASTPSLPHSSSEPKVHTAPATRMARA